MSKENKIIAYQQLTFAATDIFIGADALCSAQVNKTNYFVKTNAGERFALEIQAAANSGKPLKIEWYDPNGMTMSSRVIWAVYNGVRLEPFLHDLVELYIPLTPQQTDSMYPADDIEVFSY
ncbi:hypothetical protein A2154_02990 [Candidatus Gottesmanbacteria bacterium RBG_16_43_7]|uniref:Uncharacterized protein n=1 Tax=Candidatus Gottesmanbacteria bacterium RBG_16_43_7 TaxID=1798373 RepID=A0A1F5Z9C1_9BACT|nr:MAG: hypothetical protein A2154_02990 [Candidatus Gottesmanbacteria bacterium RBG_16_43_7]